MITSSEITSHSDFMNRRELIRKAGFVGITALAMSACDFRTVTEIAEAVEVSDFVSSYPTLDDVTEFKYFSTYTNYYEFSNDKTRSNILAQGWTPKVDTLTLKDDITGKSVVIDKDMIVAKLGNPEERIYRFRCVEAWGGNFVWNGWPLHKVLKAFGIETLKGNHISMHSAYEDGFNFGPYKEGMQTEVANHDLIFLAVGAYGNDLPGGNGPNFRVIAPHCYGYKTAKAVQIIKHQAKAEFTTWTRLSGREYPYNSVVMPNISHPRWSQKRHRVLGNGVFGKKADTLPYNGYAEEFGPIYKSLGLAVESKLI